MSPLKPRSKLIRDSRWEQIRHLFTEEEKQVLRASIVGETICPRGFTIDEAKLPATLLTKLREASV
jgi:hypothetical protein